MYILNSHTEKTKKTAYLGMSIGWEKIGHSEYDKLKWKFALMRLLKKIRNNWLKNSRK